MLPNSFPTTMPEVDEVPTLLWTSHAGQETGYGVADVLFGDEDPRGRLTQTWYASDDELPSRTAYDIAETGMTYQYYDGEPLHPFGHGRSYATFERADLRLDRRRVGADGAVEVSVGVTNTSDRDGSEVVQLDTSQRGTRVDPEAPDQQLQAFARVEVPAGETRTATIMLDVADVASWEPSLRRPVVATGLYDLRVGADARTTALRTSLGSRGERVPARRLEAGTQAEDFDDDAGVELVAGTPTAGTAVAGTDGDWLLFRNVDLGGATSVTARTARAESGTASVEVRRGSPTGPLLATLPVGSTGDRYAWTEQTAPLRGASGRADLYLVLRGEARVDAVSLGSRGLTAGEPPSRCGRRRRPRSRPGSWALSGAEPGVLRGGVGALPRRWVWAAARPWTVAPGAAPAEGLRCGAARGAGPVGGPGLHDGRA